MLSSESFKKVSFVLEIVVFFIKISAYLAVSGAVLFSETLHSLADVFDSMFIYIGFRLSRRRPDPQHPFGYGKETFFWALVTAIFMVAVTATLSIVKGVNQLLAPEPLHHLGFGLFSMAIGIVLSLVTLAMGLMVIAGGRGLSFRTFQAFLDPSVKVKVAEDVASVLGNLLAMLALFLYNISGSTVYDAAAALLVGVLLAYLGFMMAAESKDLIIGRSVSRSRRKKIRRAALSVKGVVKVMDLKTMLLGPDELLVNIEVNLVDGLDTDKVEQVIDRVRAEIELKVPEARHIQVEAESG